MAELTPTKDALLAHRLRGRGGPTATIPRREDGAPAALSFAQERLWIVEQLTPPPNGYTITSALRLRGELDVEALGRALDALAARHDSLRTVFPEIAGTPRQVVRDDATFPLEVHDVRGAGEAEREARALAAAEAARPFDLAEGPLCRAVLVRTGARDHVLVLALHHIVCDGWSLGIVIRDLDALYRREHLREDVSLPALRSRYADFAAWQRDRLGEEALEDDLAYWRRQLEALPTLTLPTDGRRGHERQFGGAVRAVTLEGGIPQQLQRMCADERATTFVVVLAAFEALLARYSGETDLPIGTPVAGRAVPELEDVVGCFVNTLVIRGDVSGNPTFRELVRRTRRVVLEALSHQSVPFERLVEELSPTRDLTRNPLFQVLFSVYGDLLPPARLGDLDVSRFEVDEVVTRFDLEAHVWTDPLSPRAEVVYSTELFGEQLMDDFATHFGRLLARLLGSPDEPVSRAAIFTADERRRLLAVGAERRLPAPVGEPLSSLVDAAAQTTPSAIAVEHGAQSLTYADLRERSNELAGRLRAIGVGPETAVAFCTSRSLSLPVAVLATWRAGGVCVPLDRKAPTSRLSELLVDSGASVLVADADAPAFPAFAGARVSADEPLLHDGGAHEDLGPVSPHTLAYVVYTSGSTGAPKPIGISRRALMNLALAQIERSHRPDATTLLFASPGFDVFFQEFASTLAGGGRLVVPSDETRDDLAAVAALVEEARVERLFLPTAALEAFAAIAVAEGRTFPALREIVVAGSRLVVTDAVAELFRRAPRCRLDNHYGPAETHVATAHVVDLARDDALPPIGRPIANVRAYLLDENLELVPRGAVGELFVAGLGVARGYVGRSAATADRFLPDRFGRPGDRMYRTGDYARISRSDELDFVGRADDQLKIHGYRIEPREVEATLQLHPGIRTATVVAFGRPGDEQLGAYCVPRSRDGVSADDVRAFVADRLPSYMVPAVVALVSELPLTVHGKIDRDALPPLELFVPRKPSIPPRTPLEELVSSVWAEVLGVEGVGATDDFFALGGNSLGAVQAMLRTRELSGLQAPVNLVFRAPTVESLARSLSTLSTAAPEEPQAAAAFDATRWVAGLSDDAVEAALEQLRTRG